MKRMEGPVRKSDIFNNLRLIAALSVFFCHAGLVISDNFNAHFIVRIIAYFPAWPGVWIFLFLSGCLMEMGFENEKHPIMGNGLKKILKNILRFYYFRFIRLAPPYYLYCLLFEIISNSGFLRSDIKALIRIITFTYNGTLGVPGIGHLWYVSMAMQFYLISPFIYILIRKIKTVKSCLCVYIVMILGFLEIRTLMDIAELDWYEWIYTFSPANLDVFVCGMLAFRLIALYNKNKIFNIKIHKIMSSMEFIILFVFSIFLYYAYMEGNFFMGYVCQFIFPSLYILVCTHLIFSFIDEQRHKSVLISEIVRNPGLFGDWFSKFSYAFYIWHAAVLMLINYVLSSNGFLKKFGMEIHYFTVAILSFIICVTISVIYTKIFNWKRG